MQENNENNHFWQQQFDIAKGSWENFNLESPQEFKLFYDHRQRLLNSGVITHQFHLHGDLILCVKAETQGMGISGKTCDVTVPQHVKDRILKKRLAEDPEYKSISLEERAALVGLDGSLDEDGNVRRCPQGSIPIIVPPLKKLIYDFKTYADSQHKYHTSSENIKDIQAASAIPREYASAYMLPDPALPELYGGEAVLSIWKPSGKFTLGQIWFSDTVDSITQTIEVGWQVDFSGYGGDNNPHFFTYTTTKNYENGSGGANLGLPYYTQVSKDFAPGFRYTTWSKFNDTQQYLRVDVEWDIPNNRIYLHVDSEVIGFWNIVHDGKTIYKNFMNGSRGFEAGGEVLPVASLPPEMGSGYKAAAGLNKAAMVAQIKVLNKNKDPIAPKLFRRETTELYTASVPVIQPKGAIFYFGGPNNAPAS